MKDKEKRRERFMRDPLPRRLGGLSATLGRIASSARESQNPTIVLDLLDEARHLIEWTASESTPEDAAALVNMQTLMTLWQKTWLDVSTNKTQRTLLSVQAKQWSDKALEISGL